MIANILRLVSRSLWVQHILAVTILTTGAALSIRAQSVICSAALAAELVREELFQAAKVERPEPGRAVIAAITARPKLMPETTFFTALLENRQSPQKLQASTEREPKDPERPDVPAEGRAEGGNSGPQPNGQRQGVQWKSLYQQSLIFLAIEHGFRLATQSDTRAALKGPFFKDYIKSVRGLSGWGDGDPFLTNYIGHSLMGAATGHIWLNNDPASRQSGLNFDRAYFKHRLRALTFSAVYSTQFELGPISEAALGNVGIRPGRKSPHPMSYTDLVVTPTVGTLWLIGEDALERFVVLPIENRTANRFLRLMVRSWLNPSRSFANLLRGRWFWHREGRGL